MNTGDFFQRMTKEALEELASGEKGWREANPNVLILACFGMLSNHLSRKISKPLWFFTGSVSAGVIWVIVSSIFNIGS